VNGKKDRERRKAGVRSPKAGDGSQERGRRGGGETWRRGEDLEMRKTPLGAEYL